MLPQIPTTQSDPRPQVHSPDHTLDMNELLGLLEVFTIQLVHRTFQLFTLWCRDNKLLCVTIHLLPRDGSLEVMLLEFNKHREARTVITSKLSHKLITAWPK